ncbi:SRPBCC family protein [Nocardia sp. NPDC050697]|uniref:SRPBCC family protein n=1 Tax=Nocardia sp. NPDC050697 TaxID=3155158 RepID=UPI0033EE90A8
MADFEVARRTVIAAEPARVHGLIDDFHQWVHWSPWEDVDPELNRRYAGPESGVGASYTWNGNRKAGHGTMTITSSTEHEIGVRVEFRKPIAATNDVRFELATVASGTEVTWRMTGKRSGFLGVVGRVIPMDRFIGKDFEKGLARLKAAAEQPA